MATVKTLDTEVELLKREVADMKLIHVRLDSAIEKIADVSTSLHTIMAVHEEKLLRQEEQLDEQQKEFRDTVQELHSRITTNAKETEQFLKLREELQTRVGILEKWRHLIIGGAIVIGFILQKFLPTIL